MSVYNVQYPGDGIQRSGFNSPWFPNALQMAQTRILIYKWRSARNVTFLYCLNQLKSDSKNPHEQGLNSEYDWCCQLHRLQHQDQAMTLGKPCSHQLRQLSLTTCPLGLWIALPNPGWRLEFIEKMGKPSIWALPIGPVHWAMTNVMDDTLIPHRLFSPSLAHLGKPFI